MASQFLFPRRYQKRDPFQTFENQRSLIKTVGFVGWDDLERCHV